MVGGRFTAEICDALNAEHVTGMSRRNDDASDSGGGCFMSTTYHSLASGNLTQNWADAASITTNDSWAGVPSITGYLGDIDAPRPRPAPIRKR